MLTSMDVRIWMPFCVLMAVKTSAMMMPNGQSMSPNIQTLSPDFQNMPPGYQNMPPDMSNMQSNIPGMPPGMSGMPNFPGMPPMPNLQSLAGGLSAMTALTNMMPGYPCDRDIPCQGDTVCRMVAKPCYSPPCPRPRTACVDPSSLSSGASCPLGAPILAPDQMTEMRCTMGGRECPAKTKCHIDATDNIYVCCWDETATDGKLGTCPVAKGPGRCVQSCFDDTFCPGNQKCCFNGCGRECVNPTPMFLGGNFPNFNLPNTPMPGFPSSPSAQSNALDGFQSMMTQNGMPQMPNFNIPPSVNQNNQQNMWQQNAPSSNALSFSSRQTGTTTFPSELPGMSQMSGMQSSGFRQNMGQGSQSGGPGYPNGAMSGFSTGTQSMYHNGQQTGFPSGGRNSLQQDSQQMFNMRFPFGSQPQQGLGFQNDSQMGFPGSTQIRFPSGYPGGFPGSQSGPSSSWSDRGLPNVYNQPAGSSINFNTGSGQSQSAQSSGPNVSPGDQTSPRVLIPGATVDRQTALQNALNSIVPSIDQLPQPTANPDNQNSTNSSNASSVYPQPDTSVWSPQTESSTVNVTNVSEPGTANGTDAGSASTVTDPVNKTAPGNEAQTQTQSGDPASTGSSPPSNSGPSDQNSLPNQFPNQPPSGFPNNPPPMFPPGFPNQFHNLSPDGFPDQNQNQSPYNFLKQPPNGMPNQNQFQTGFPNQNENSSPMGFPNNNQNQSPMGLPNNNQNQSPMGFPNNNQNQSPMGFPNQNQNQTPMGFPNNNQNQSPMGFPNNNQNQSPMDFPNQNQNQSPMGFPNNNQNQSPMSFSNQNQNQSPMGSPNQNQKPGQCPHVYGVGKCQHTCSDDSACLFSFKCCNIGPCRACMYPKMENVRRSCSFQDKINGLCSWK